MTTQDIRWIQRFNNFTKALAQMRKFIEKGELSELEKQGLIQAFEYTFELAEKIASDTANIYFQEFVALYAKLDSLKGETE